MSTALDHFCGSTFWNASLLDRPDPDLPVCFEHTVLVWVPLAFLWLSAPWHLVPLLKRKLSNAHLSRLYMCKQVLASLLLLTAIAGLAVTLGEDYGPSNDREANGANPAVLYNNPVLFTISWVLVILYQESMRKMGAVDSGSLFLFWLLLIICEAFSFQTILREALQKGAIEDLPRFCLFYIAFGLQVLALILSAFADIPPEAVDLVKKNPELGASFLSRLTFNWVNSMVVSGYRRLLVQEDLWDLKEEDSTDRICQGFEETMKWELMKARSRMKNHQRTASQEQKTEPCPNGLAKGVSQDVLVMEETSEEGKKKKKKDGEKEAEYPSSWLVSTIGKTFKGVLLESAVLKFLHDLLSFIAPQLLKLLVSYTHDMTIYTWTGYLYTVLLLLVNIVQSLFMQQYLQRCFVLGTQVRTAITAAVYKKTLVVSNDARKECTVGETVNLMSADAQRFNDVTNSIQQLWSCPLQIALAIMFLWLELGPSTLAGLAVMVLMVPINGLLATKSRGFQMENMKYKDNRMKIMNEMLNGIKTLKLYAWEPPYEAQVQEIREKELGVMKKFAYLISMSTFFFACVPALVSLATFAVFVSVTPENVLDAQKAFTSISLFNLLSFPLEMLPLLISAIVQASVSKKRLEKFLGAEDLDRKTVCHDSSFNTAVSVCDGTFAWGKDIDPVLKSVSLDIKPGRLVAVVGAVGAGKSSLISAILGEMHSIKGYINIMGSVAYVPQQAWIQNATLRDNILFGSALEEARFQKVLDACALVPDLELLPGGDQTEIGEKGINLSGGQKQRVSMARAVYSSADIFLLDDPLSAVDSHVGKHLFNEVVGPNGLLKDKTRILVTHGVSFLPQVDEIVVLVDGKVSEIGSYNNLKASGGAFSEFLRTYAMESSQDHSQPGSDVTSGSDKKEMDGVPERQEPQVDCSTEDVVSATVNRENSLRHSQYKARLKKHSSVKKLKDVPPSNKGQNLIEKEAMETGKVKFSMYLQYLKAMGWGYCIIVFVVYLLQNIAFIGQNLWLSDWTNDSAKYENDTYPNSVRDMRVGVFGALGVAQGILVFLATLLMANGAIAASRIMHTRLLSNILRAPMLFFDTTPLGRVVNRFAKDMFTVDEAIPMSFRSWLMSLLEVICTMFVICLATPIFTAVIFPLAVIYYFVQRFYVATSRQLSRLDSVSRSPIYSHFSETISGLSVIRAYGHQDCFLRHNETTIDENLKSVYPWVASNRWLSIRLEFLGNLVVFFSALFAVISRGHIYSGLVGLTISYALNVTQTLNLLVRMTSELETNIVAVERVNEYAEIETEAPWVTDNRPPKGWPDSGKLCLKNYQVRYRPELELVLHGITCDIESTEKIGIVGRTGAGKSSLTNCLFRIIEAAGGQIFIDGVDIATLGLHDLRSRLTIIPQDPVLFSGTLRMNLDPFEKFNNEDVWRVLELAHLKAFVGGLKDGLNHEVTEGGGNLSVGQRQLLCLARALLRKSRILILDEATAAVDLEMDSLIQTTIRQEFSHCTVLTIAHRIHTILDSSRVMVLDAGKIVEFDCPSVLLKRQGHFYAMAKDAGITSLDNKAL
ncbi:ATP-binding cassette sub-family C member 2-like isoform X1 [Conger conger]|uniref:ATP-binding cassette sub-family C member 2-like isoform X1 n=1 Tax=Conger conger TaxID=82655 RepID=UPI002A5AE45D|nr:ATP-binding cassette sub-family C member 2-like isoform X1 [Conger conger]